MSEGNKGAGSPFRGRWWVTSLQQTDELGQFFILLSNIDQLFALPLIAERGGEQP